MQIFGGASVCNCTSLDPGKGCYVLVKASSKMIPVADEEAVQWFAGWGDSVTCCQHADPPASTPL